MILSQQLINKTRVLLQLDLPTFRSVLQFTLVLYFKGSEASLHELLDSTVQYAQAISQALTQTLRFLVKIRSSEHQRKNGMQLLGLGKQKSDLVLESANKYQMQLRQILLQNQFQGTKFQGLKARVDIQTASRTFKQSCFPKLILQLNTSTQGRLHSHHYECSAATLRQLIAQLRQALRLQQKVTKKIKGTIQ